MSLRNVRKLVKCELFHEGKAHSKTCFGQLKLVIDCELMFMQTCGLENENVLQKILHFELLLWKKERNTLTLFRDLRNLMSSIDNLHISKSSEIARKKIFFISENAKGKSKEMSHLSKKLMRRIRHQKFSRQKWRCVKKF